MKQRFSWIFFDLFRCFQGLFKMTLALFWLPWLAICVGNWLACFRKMTRGLSEISDFSICWRECLLYLLLPSFLPSSFRPRCFLIFDFRARISLASWNPSGPTGPTKRTNSGAHEVSVAGLSGCGCDREFFDAHFLSDASHKFKR